VEEVPAGEGPLVLRGIKARRWIDHVELGVGSQEIEDQPGGVAALGPDLHHRA
jgi:hypothetical protein